MNESRHISLIEKYAEKEEKFGRLRNQSCVQFWKDYGLFEKGEVVKFEKYGKTKFGQIVNGCYDVDDQLILYTIKPLTKDLKPSKREYSYVFNIPESKIDILDEY